MARFALNKTFDDAFNNSTEARSQKDSSLVWKVIALDDLLDNNKAKAARPKDLLDIREFNNME